MAQGVPNKEVEKMIKAEENLRHDDPFHDVKEQILHEVDVTKSLQDSGEKSPPPQSFAGEGVVKSDVAPTFVEEYKKDHKDETQPETKKEQ